MKRHHLFLLIILAVASISASATCLYDGGKGGTTPPNPKSAPETTRDIETVPIIISCDDDKVVPVVPHDCFEHLDVNVKTDLFARQMEIIYGFGLGHGQIVIMNTRAGLVYQGTVTSDTDRYIANPSIFEGDWFIGILVQDEQGKNVAYHGDFIYKGRPPISF